MREDNNDDDDDDDDNNDANFAYNPNVHIGRVHSITDKAMLAPRQRITPIEALVNHHQFGGRF